ncbi:uncharacterized protein LOC128709257 [Anopheles marshallii]|uniref:uncharacterized protein LOC128709257 n=1 Tax=Anopheles marshallii TaxID=1521116 RepID=UPI00237C0527|nr:uncharacterized protein LOC128709257 [Anopheles marshallii]
MNGLVEVVVFVSVLVAGPLMRKVDGEDNFFEHAESSQHVMHIRKLSDSDKLRIELEPVWFHLESTEKHSPSESQQVKRQADLRRPFQVYSNREEFSRNQQRRDSRSDDSTNDNADSFLKDFWQVDRPNKFPTREITKQSTSIEQQLENTNLPSCFRKYLHEMYDRNSKSVRQLMRCLAQQSDESCLADADRTQYFQSPYFDSEEDGYYTKDKRVRRMPERKLERKRKYNEPYEMSQEDPSVEELKFEQLFIRSDSDTGGQIFEPLKENNASQSDDSDESSSSSDTRKCNADTKSRDSESHESEQRLYTHNGRLRPVAYRRLPQKYNTRSRKQSNSDESGQHSSGEENGESYEQY